MSRFLADPPVLAPITVPFAIGLEAAIQEIFHAPVPIATPSKLSALLKEYTGLAFDLSSEPIPAQNALLACLLQEVANKNGDEGWLMGWQCLAKACPDCHMYEKLIEDVATGVRVYKTVKVKTEPRVYPIDDITFSVVVNPTAVNEIGAKTIGGHGWKTDPSYKAVCQKWNDPDIPMSPCPFFAWIGVAKKVETFRDPQTAEDFWTAQLLGIVDYDFDKDPSDPKCIALGKAIRDTAKMAVQCEGRMRGSGWVGLLTMDQQLFSRNIQYDWIAANNGPWVIGRDQFTAKDWAAACYVDCAALAPFAYQTAEELLPSRTAMYVAVIFANMHDFLYDRGCHSRISSTPFAAASGVFEYDLPQAWVIGMIDAIATKTLHDDPDQKPLYGDNALYATCVWDIFNVRYRAWERFVKYTRMLRASKSETAAAICANAEQCRVLVPEDLTADIGDAFEAALDPANAKKLVLRSEHTVDYTLGDPAEALAAYDFALPELCSECSTPFQTAVRKLGDTIQAIPNLPASVIVSSPVPLAAALRRGAYWAATSDKCCDACACTIGLWANLASDKVTISLMEAELVVCSRDWLLMNYAMGCVAFSPLRLISILAGFDLNVDIEYCEGAMGDRDVVDA